MLGQVRFWSPLSRNLPAIGPFDQKPQQKHDKSKTHYTIAMVEAANSETPDTSDFSLFSSLKAQAESNFEIASPEPACMPWRSRLNWWVHKPRLQRVSDASKSGMAWIQQRHIKNTIRVSQAKSSRRLEDRTFAHVVSFHTFIISHFPIDVCLQKGKQLLQIWSAQDCPGCTSPVLRLQKYDG